MGWARTGRVVLLTLFAVVPAGIPQAQQQYGGWYFITPERLLKMVHEDLSRQAKPGK